MTNQLFQETSPTVATLDDLARSVGRVGTHFPSSAPNTTSSARSNPATDAATVALNRLVRPFGRTLRRASPPSLTPCARQFLRPGDPGQSRAGPGEGDQPVGGGARRPVS